MLAQPGVGALVDVLAGVHGGRELVAGRAAALVRAGQVDALRQPAARRARLPALVHVAAQVGRVVVLVAGMIKLLQNACTTKSRWPLELESTRTDDLDPTGWLCPAVVILRLIQ